MANIQEWLRDENRTYDELIAKLTDLEVAANYAEEHGDYEIARSFWNDYAKVTNTLDLFMEDYASELLYGHSHEILF